jgi:hypothetical protein
MNITHTLLTNKVHLLLFDTQKELTHTFLRFQEHYESPRFKGKIFTVKEFKKYYLIATNKKKFNYYTYWVGFNIPYYILWPFYYGFFNPLTKQEHQLLDLFKNETDKFYIIATFKRNKHKNETIKHELAHALFYTNKKYRNKVLQILKNYDLTQFKNKLISMNYNTSVINDEIHAYCIDGSDDLKIPFPPSLFLTLNNHYLNNIGV